MSKAIIKRPFNFKWIQNNRIFAVKTAINFYFYIFWTLLVKFYILECNLNSLLGHYAWWIPLTYAFKKQAEKLKSREMKEGWMKNDEVWMKDEWRMMKDEGWMMKDDDFKLLRGFASEQTDRRTDICECRVAFAAKNWF